jgi:hypothetical protein
MLEFLFRRLLFRQASTVKQFFVSSFWAMDKMGACVCEGLDGKACIGKIVASLHVAILQERLFVAVGRGMNGCDLCG